MNENEAVRIEVEITYDEVDGKYILYTYVNGEDQYGNEALHAVRADTLDDAQREAEDILNFCDDTDMWDCAEVELMPIKVSVSQERIDRNNDLDNVMTAQEIADTFHIHRQTVHDAIDRAYIPARQSGKTWLIHRADAAERWSKTDKLRSLALLLTSAGLTAALWVTAFAA